MSAAKNSILLHEWETLDPDDCQELKNRFLDGSPGTQSVVKSLADRNLLEITELRHGLKIGANSHVGSVQIGDLHVKVLPKLEAPDLLQLVRYAWGFRRLNLISSADLATQERSFEDLLISQLNAEVQELIARGLRRTYVATNAQLASPRGRIDFARLASDRGTLTATLPCQHYPRIEDTLLNRVVLAGLRCAAALTGSLELRRDSLRLGSLMEEQVSRTKLNASLLQRANRERNRLTTAYSPALSIIRLLFEGQGVVLEGESERVTLPGFLFDMNRFFQALISRFLKENLPGYSVHDEQGLKGMMRYHPQWNPRNRRSPTPRPDFVVTRNGTNCAILDAKYRDLWEKELPEHMLYQLVVYAVSQRQQPQSSILYPTTNPRATEARIDVADPIYGKPIGQVCLRPVHLPTLVDLVCSPGNAARRQCAGLATQFAFGSVP